MKPEEQNASADSATASSIIHHPSSFTLAVVLARGGSKGLPRKNVLPVAGRPMVAWTLEHALRSARVSAVVLSTDDAEAATVARGLGVEVIDRPAELAHDTATVDSAARHAVQRYEATHGVAVGAAVILYGNVPVRPADLSDRAVAMLAGSGADSVQSVAPVGKMHPYWMKRLEPAEGGDRLVMYEDNAVYRRQDLPPVYMLDGGVIAVTRASLFTVAEGQPHAFLGADRRAVVTGPGEVVDVDDATDRRVAEAILAGRG